MGVAKLEGRRMREVGVSGRKVFTRGVRVKNEPVN